MNNFPAILVTGGAGYVGSHAVLALLDRGYRVIVLDNLSTGFERLVDRRALFVRGAIEDHPLVRPLLAEHRVKAILHFAGSVVVPESVTNPLKYYQNNSAASLSLIESAVACGVKTFVFSSTAATYGIPDKCPITEDSAQRPINPYGQSKLITEMMLRDVATANGLRFAILRYFNVAGADPAGRSGQSSKNATHLIKIAAEVATGKRSHVSIFGDNFSTPDGTGVRDYIHVSDLAEAHILALRYLFDRPLGNLILNCGYGRGYSVTEVLDLTEKVTGISMNRVIEGRRSGDPDILVSDNNAIVQTLGWQPRFNDLATMIYDACNWEKRVLKIDPHQAALTI